MPMSPATRDRQLPQLALYLAASFGAATVGGLFTARSVRTWYLTLARPSWNPPSWLFGPVWTVLYAQMAFAAWLVRRAAAKRALPDAELQPALRAWWLQLVLNVAWSATFFGARRIGASVVAIAALWAAIAATAARFGRITRAAGWLLLPYLAWTTFASALNLRIWQLNRRPAPAARR